MVEVYEKNVVEEDVSRKRPYQDENENENQTTDSKRHDIGKREFISTSCLLLKQISPIVSTIMFLFGPQPQRS